MNDFSLNIIKKIEEQGIEPRPRWHFLFRNSVFWFLALLSLIIGGMAAAVMLYAFTDSDTFLPESLSGSSFEDFLQGISFVWMGVLGVFITITYFGFRKTKKGYRYPTAKVLLCSLVLSLLLGLLLNLFDFGPYIHSLF